MVKFNFTDARGNKFSSVIKNAFLRLYTELQKSSDLKLAGISHSIYSYHSWTTVGIRYVVTFGDSSWHTNVSVYISCVDEDGRRICTTNIDDRNNQLMISDNENELYEYIFKHIGHKILSS